MHHHFKPYNQTKYKLLTCAVLYRECYYCASKAKHFIDVQIIEQGLHDIGTEKMSSRLQKEIDKVDAEKYKAILLGYGLCNNGIVGLKSELPLVVPRGHDCITILLGSKEKFQKYFDANPGTFFQSAGWIEQAKDNLSNPESTTRLMGIGSYQEYVKEYGEENAKYIIKSLGGGLNHYDKFAYIDTKVGDQSKLKEHAKQNAKDNNWKYEELEGNTNLLLKMMNGEWDEDNFLVIQPGESIEPSYCAKVIKTKE
ncbi:DUF1638 domain-containing protein [Draconibacterium sp.]|nr:DUF1638 domain-containing protein [Draconibacterium sp.]